MKYTKLGKTNISISRIAMGCWIFAGGANWGTQEETESINTVHAAMDAGINFFDTAEGYSSDDYSETVLGKALAGRRDKVVVATKVSRTNMSAQKITEACENSLQRLNTDYIDLYQIHWSNPDIPLEESIGALERLKEQGKIRVIGVSNFGVGDMSDFLATSRFETNQLPYSLLWRAIEYQIKQKCIEENVGILCYSPLQQGLLTGRYTSADEFPQGRARTRIFSTDRPDTRHGEPGHEAETFAAIDKIRAICNKIEQPMAQVALAWLLQQPGVSSVIAGARTPEQIQETAQAAELALSPEIIAQLSAATDELKAVLGPNPDPWQSESRYR